MCFISLDRKKVRLFSDVLFVCSPSLDQEISPFFYNGRRPLVILKPYAPSEAFSLTVWLLINQSRHIRYQMKAEYLSY